MKKQYIIPEMEVIEIKTQQQILTSSTPVLGEEEYVPGTDLII